MRLLLTRHGETEWNKTNRVLGRSDIPLNNTGVEQAKQMVDILHDVKICAVYSSPLKRAYYIGNLIAKDHNLECVVDIRLIEMNFGIFEGVMRNDKKYLQEKRELFSRYPEGESYMGVAGRVYPFIQDIEKKYKYKDTVLVITHNGICRVIANYFVDMSVEDFVSFSMRNCEIKEFYL